MYYRITRTTPPFTSVGEAEERLRGEIINDMVYFDSFAIDCVDVGNGNICIM